MSHVLIFGQTPDVAVLKARLKGWGMSTGELLPGVGSASHVSVDDCDAVILDLRGTDCPDWFSPFLADHDLAAPVLVLLGKDKSQRNLSGPWVEILDDDAMNSGLLLELQGAIAWSRQKRGLGAGSPGGSYLHFLGHELRSPLTAAKTALEALQGELASVSKPSERKNDPNEEAVLASIKMAGIALRNIQRMQQTVEWSQDLLAHMEVLDSEEESVESSVLI